MPLPSRCAGCDNVWLMGRAASTKAASAVSRLGGSALLLLLAGCSAKKPAEDTYFDRAITPPLPIDLDPCSQEVPANPSFQADVDPSDADFPEFKALVHPVLGESCALGNCHGSPTNALRLVCGGSDDVLARWNYFAATQ